jgi:acetyl esterase/lipase
MDTRVYKRAAGCALELDVYLPDGDPSGIPAAVFFHGGALIWGSRKDVNPAELAAVLESGMAYVSVDYRLAPETNLMEIRADVEDALKWVRGEGARLYGFDPEKVAVLGKSAGGYLALLTGTFPDPPNAIVSFYGYGDILGDWYARPSAHYLMQPPVSPEDAARCVQEGTPTHAAHAARWPLYLHTRQTGNWAKWTAGYEKEEAATALLSFCPIRNIGQHYPPTLLLHGSSDTDVPVEQSIAMAEALTDAGIAAKLLIQPGGGHGFDGAWKNASGEFCIVTEFLRDHFCTVRE